jgi:AraC-like DNA-binding protein
MAGTASEVGTVQVRSYAAVAEAHAHPYHQLVLPLAGSLELEIGPRGGVVCGGTGALVPTGERHAFAASGGNRFLVLDLPPGAVERTGTREALHRLADACFFPVPRAAAGLARWFAHEVAGGDAAPAILVSFSSLLLHAASAPAPRREPAAVKCALAYIEARGLGPVRLADVARAAGTSAGHLHALLRAHVGRAPRSLIRARRVEEARRLLAETELSIAEIALRCGFADQTSLTHAVRRELGTTPGRLRRSRA